MARIALVIGALAAIVYPIPLQLQGQTYYQTVGFLVLVNAMLGVGWNVIGGWAGQFDFGPQVFFAVGAYTAALLYVKLGVDAWLGLLAGVAVAAVLCAILTYPLTRLRGHYFAIATIAVGEIVQTFMINWDWVGGARGLFIPIDRTGSLLAFQFRDKQVYYYIALGLLLLALWVTRRIERSRTGYYFRAIREDQDAAASLGIPVARYKQRAMAVSAALTALGGTFYAQYILFIDPESVLPLSLSILICLIAVLGGVGTLWGPLIGAAILVPLGEATRIYLGGTGKAIDLLIYGFLIMVISVIQPGGIMALAQRGRRRTG